MNSGYEMEDEAWYNQ